MPFLYFKGYNFLNKISKVGNKIWGIYQRLYRYNFSKERRKTAVPLTTGAIGQALSLLLGQYVFALCQDGFTCYALTDLSLEELSPIYTWRDQSTRMTKDLFSWVMMQVDLCHRLYAVLCWLLFNEQRLAYKYSLHLVSQENQ